YFVKYRAPAKIEKKKIFFESYGLQLLFVDVAKYPFLIRGKDYLSKGPFVGYKLDSKNNL
ncbi:MAG: hypothetical protein CO102_02495, partial [Candidatus Brennerbacteria bacterium CG_4_9_14_3_um_filter_43_9]